MMSRAARLLVHAAARLRHFRLQEVGVQINANGGNTEVSRIVTKAVGYKIAILPPGRCMNVQTTSVTDRLKEVLMRSKKNFGPDIGQQMDALLSPLNLTIMVATLALWAGSHFFGVGEVVDVLLLTVGFFLLVGLSAMLRPTSTILLISH